jgi:hypothetical protein
VGDIPDLDPTEPGIFDRILKTAARVRAERHARIGEIRETARLIREKALAEFRLREEEAERRRGAERRQRALDGLPEPSSD